MNYSTNNNAFLNGPPGDRRRYWVRAGSHADSRFVMVSSCLIVMNVSHSGKISPHPNGINE